MFLSAAGMEELTTRQRDLKHQLEQEQPPPQQQQEVKLLHDGQKAALLGRLAVWRAFQAPSSLPRLRSQLSLYAVEPDRPPPKQLRRLQQRMSAYTLPRSKGIIAAYTGERVNHMPDIASTGERLAVFNCHDGTFINPVEVGGMAVMANGAHLQSKRVNCGTMLYEDKEKVEAVYLDVLDGGVAAGAELLWDYAASCSDPDEYNDILLNPLCACCEPPIPLMSLIGAH